MTLGRALNPVSWPKSWRWIVAFIAAQYLFASGVWFATGSDLLPPLVTYWKFAVVLWTLAPLFLALVEWRRGGKEALWPRVWPRAFRTLASMVAFGTSFAALTWAKAMIPAFPLDLLLADLDKAIFLGTDPWQYFRISWLHWPYALSYVYWFAAVYTGLIVMALVDAQRARIALVSVILICAVDTVLQHLLPSAGPIFWENLELGDRFAELSNGPPIYTMFADYLWEGRQAGVLKAGMGISAMPSMHVALSAWLVFAYPGYRLLTVPYMLMVWAASIASGWHYWTDGLVGIALAWAAVAFANRYFTDADASSSKASSWGRRKATVGKEKLT